VALFVGLIYFLLTRDLRPLVLMVLVGVTFFLVDLLFAARLMPLWDLQRRIPRPLRMAVGYAVPVVLILLLTNIPLPGFLAFMRGLLQNCFYFLGYIAGAAIAYVFLKSPLPERVR
jgi:hypothetical protein